MAYILRSSTVIRRHWFSGVVTGTPTAQLYVSGVASGSPLVGTGADDAWVFSVAVGALAFGTSVEIWAVGLVGATTERVKLVDGFIAGTNSDVGTQTKQDEMLAAIAGLDSISITRIGPEYNAANRTITLIAGDDYLAGNGNALTFAVTFPGIDLSAATAVYGGSGDYLDLLNGSATLIDIDTATPKLRLEWTREQTNKTPSKKYCWGVAIIVGGKVQTVVGGNLILKPPLVPIAIVDAELA